MVEPHAKIFGSGCTLGLASGAVGVDPCEDELALLLMMISFIGTLLMCPLIPPRTLLPVLVQTSTPFANFVVWHLLQHQRGQNGIHYSIAESERYGGL